MSETTRITAPSGEWLEIEKRGPCATFRQLGYLLGLHRTTRITGSRMSGKDGSWAHANAKRTGLNSWTLYSNGTEGYAGEIVKNLPLHDILMRMHRYEQKAWRDRLMDGNLRFGRIEGGEPFQSNACSLERMAHRTGLSLPV